MKMCRQWSLWTKLIILAIFLLFAAIGCSHSSSQKSQRSSPSSTSATAPADRGASTVSVFTNWPLMNQPPLVSKGLAMSIAASPARQDMVFGMGKITALALSSDSSTVAVGTEDGEIVFLDAGSGAILRVLEGHSANIVGISFGTPEYLVSIAKDASVKKWKLPECVVVQSLDSQVFTNSEILAAAFSTDGAHLVAAATDGCLYAISTADLSIADTLCNIFPSFLAASADGRYIAYYDSLKNFVIYDSYKKAPVICFLPGKRNDSFAFDAKGNPTPIITNIKLRLGKNEFTIPAIKAPGEIVVGRLKTFPSQGFNSAEPTFTCVYRENLIVYFVTVNYFDLSWKTLKVDLSPFNYYSICGVSIAPNGTIAVVMPDQCNYVIPIGLQPIQAGVHVKLKDVGNLFVWIDDSDFIVANDQFVYRYRLDNKLVWETQVSYFLWTWNLSPTGRYVAIFHDKGITLWDCTTRQAKWTLSRTNELNFSNAAFYKNIIPLFSPSEDTLFLFNNGSKGKGILLLSTKSGELLRHISVDAEIYSWAISSNGERLFLGLNGRIIVLNVQTGTQQNVALPFQGKIVSITEDETAKILFGVAEGQYKEGFYVFVLNANSLQIVGGVRSNEEVIRVYYHRDNIFVVTKDRNIMVINPSNASKAGTQDKITIFINGIEVTDSSFTDWHPLKNDLMVYVGSGYAVVSANTKEIIYANPNPTRSDITVKDYSGRVLSRTPKYELRGPSPSQLRLSDDRSIFGVVINHKVVICKLEDLVETSN